MSGANGRRRIGRLLVIGGSHTNAPSANDGDTLAITDTVVHILADGYGYDLVEGRPLLPNGDPIEPPADGTVSVSRRTRERQSA